MSGKPKRQKMCWNCEGNVNLDEENCPYCQVALFPQTDDDNSSHSHNFSPPYKSQNHLLSSSIPKSPYGQNSEAIAPDASEIDENAEEGEEPSDDLPVNDAKQIVVTMAMLMAGLVFFLFGWILFAFSSNGYLVLRWSDTYWFVYLGLGALMLFLGFRSLSSVDDEAEPL